MKKSAAKKAATRTTATTPAPAAGSVSARSDRTAAAPAGASDAPAAGSKTRATRSEARARSARATADTPIQTASADAVAVRERTPAEPAIPAPAQPIAAESAAKGATMAKPADTKTAAGRKPVKAARSAAETEKIRAALAARRDELQTEYDQTLSEITELQRDRLGDSAGDDQADTGTKTFEREQEISLANNILERISQVERALERLDAGNYGWCERCGNPIPVERLAAFPSATLCVTCKQLEERR